MADSMRLDKKNRRRNTGGLKREKKKENKNRE
jgi:hypothetical protein